RYISNGQNVMQTSGNGDAKTALYQIFGKDTAQKMIQINFENEKFILKGYAGKPEIARPNRNGEIFFVNRRYIKSDLMRMAAEEAIKPMLTGGRFPFFVLDLTVGPGVSDINVHPAKTEARFSNEADIYSFIKESLADAYSEANLVPSVILEAKTTAASFFSKETEKSPVIKNGESVSFSFKEEGEAKAAPHVPLSWAEGYKVGVTKPDSLSGKKKSDLNDVFLLEKLAPEQQKNPFYEEFTIVGQIFGTYWIVSHCDSIFLLDQHAAHERILYEEISESMDNGTEAAQLLLHPLPLRLSPQDKQVLNDYGEIFERLGFEIVNNGFGETAVSSLPFGITELSAQSFFSEVLDKLSKNVFNNQYAALKRIVAMSACKAAVKAHDKLSTGEARAMIDKMLTLENPFNCPHGRPTMVELPRTEIEKMFRRVNP
ncbi:MAG: DNA mismatch repair endonuclease MutL, partial [Defluviitaleaceae bacterium]|nr:DNA mismatch repair endonuclease MutL [Defluviitaleaceae bacterium]